MYPAKQRKCLTVVRPEKKDQAIWVHPGEPCLRTVPRRGQRPAWRPGPPRRCVFVDPTVDKPYLFHLALVSVVRQADPELPDLADEEVLDCRLVGVKQFEGAEVVLCPVEHLLLLKGGHGLPPAAQRLALIADKLKAQAEAFMVERVARSMADRASGGADGHAARARAVRPARL